VSYINSLQGSKPANAKAPEGEIYTEGANTMAVDTTAKATDSTTLVTK
jgi:hypothetical protein